MNVVHVMRNGSKLKDIKGHIVKMNDAENVYGLIDSINRNGKKVEKNEKKQNA